MAYGCEVLFGAKRAQDMQDMIERATGDVCPCKRGRVCPLLPREGAVQQPSPEMVAVPA